MLVLLPLTAAAAADPIRLPDSRDRYLGRHIDFLQEDSGPLSLEQAEASLRDGKFQSGKKDVLDFGMVPRPVWLHLDLDNTTSNELRDFLLFGVTWYDRMDVYFLRQGVLQRHVLTGDDMAHPEGFRPPQGFALPLDIAPGRSEVYVRIESLDPVPVPLEIVSGAGLEARATHWNYFYGMFYGFLGALCIYNLLLFAGMRERSYLYYSVALIALVICNIAYTGHGMAWFWPDSPVFQNFIGSVFMVIYSAAAWTFACRLLELERVAPKLHRTIRISIQVALAGQLLGILLVSKLTVLWVAFVYTSLLTLGMPLLGGLAVYRGWPYGRYFLAASAFAMLGVASTVLSTGGAIPFNGVTYHGTEYGLVIESTLLALALAFRMRKYRQDGLLAHVDALTGLNNRRSFLESAASLVAVHDRRKRTFCVALMDLDFFKRINDQHGHKAGDDVLVAVADLLASQCRAGDIVARWGGEEFILLMGETEVSHAAAFADRLRQAISELNVTVDGKERVSLSASIGIVQRTTETSLDELISRADMQLYRAKNEGRNRVCYLPA